MESVKVEDQDLGRPISVGIAASSFNRYITDRLLAGAHEELKAHPVKVQDTIWVAGAFELPAILSAMADTERYNALLALGCIIRGETCHFDIIAAQCAAGCMNVSVERSIPVGFGVLAVDTMEQAVERSESGDDNRGSEAASAIIRSAHAISYVRLLI